MCHIMIIGHNLFTLLLRVAISSNLSGAFRGGVLAILDFWGSVSLGWLMDFQGVLSPLVYA